MQSVCENETPKQKDKQNKFSWRKKIKELLTNLKLKIHF